MSNKYLFFSMNRSLFKFLLCKTTDSKQLINHCVGFLVKRINYLITTPLMSNEEGWGRSS
jgi:hypothetical protein